MKLYTEEQVSKVWKAGQKYWETSGASTTLEELLEQLTPIELPSDEEIEDESPYVSSDASLDFWAHKEGFIDGAKWMLKIIQGGNK